MKKRILAMIFAAFMVLAAAGCGSSNTAPAESGSAAQTQQAQEPAAEDSEEVTTYQSILDDYTAKLEKAAPKLADEYTAEAADMGSDINALAKLSNDKTEELAKICNDGVEEMAKLMQANGDDYDTYEEWAGKLQAVYTDEAQKITDAYTESAT